MHCCKCSSGEIFHRYGSNSGYGRNLSFSFPSALKYLCFDWLWLMLSYLYDYRLIFASSPRKCRALASLELSRARQPSSTFPVQPCSHCQRIHSALCVVLECLQKLLRPWCWSEQSDLHQQHLHCQTRTSANDSRCLFGHC